VSAEETIEILNSLVAEQCCNSADLCRRCNGQDPTGKLETDVKLVLRHRFSVTVGKETLKRSHFYAKLSGDRPDS